MGGGGAANPTAARIGARTAAGFGRLRNRQGNFSSVVRRVRRNNARRAGRPGAAVR